MTAPPYTSDDGHIVYGKCYASYVRSISDRDGDPDPYPDIELLSGTVKFESVYDSAGARPALPLPALPRTKGVVISGDTYEVKNSNLVDKEGREGVWLVLSVDDIPLTWRATVTLTDERNRVLLNTAYIITEGVWEVELDGRHVINLPDLIPNPGALTPVEGSALRAAQQTLDEIRVLKDLIDTSKMEIDNSESSALTYRNEAEGFKTAAETARTAAQTARTGAETARTGAESARDTANTHRTAAQTARTGAETARDRAEDAKADIDVTHGHVHQDVTHADTHALAAGSAAQTATTKALEASTSAGTATTKAGEAAQSAADALTYRNTAQGAATTATDKAGEATTAAQTATDKAAQTEIDALTLAQRVETGTKELGVTSDGKLYFLEQPVEEVPLTVDNTVGTRVFLGGTMIYADTGDRDMDHLLPEGWSATTFRLRRVGQLVTIAIVELKADVSSGNTGLSEFIPSGFLPTPRHMFALSGVNYVQINTAGGMSFIGLDGGNIQGVIAYHTHKNWPTELPGIPGPGPSV